ncbi:MAG: crossover junction endodeoxyribonuclease RuvC [bacterium]|nr:crossover junction endodeoxyribonuclease RuvC [bacterium]
MIVLGIDPGTHRMGYGVVRKEGGRQVFVDAGLVTIKTKNGFGALLDIKNELEKIIKKFKPRAVAIEKIYFSKNVKTAIAVAQARGVAILAALENGVEVREFGPNEVKGSITGYGLADKKAVLKMVKLTLNEPDLMVIDDASDALALAIICINRLGSKIPQ